MKIACSSATFARELIDGTMTQLEWLDACANELEVDGVVFDLAQFARLDLEYLAQLKKHAADLGLTVAGVDAADLFAESGVTCIEVAVALGAPLAIGPAPHANDDAAAWGAFTALAGRRAREAKRANVTLAVRNVSGSLCATSGDLRRLAKDVDSSWLRFAFDLASFSEASGRETLLAKSVIAWHDIVDLATFALPDDERARLLDERLARFRGFIVLGGVAPLDARPAYHAAIERYIARRAATLAAS